jgi:hypothetical protein
MPSILRLQFKGKLTHWTVENIILSICLRHFEAGTVIKGMPNDLKLIGTVIGYSKLLYFNTLIMKTKILLLSLMTSFFALQMHKIELGKCDE